MSYEEKAQIILIASFINLYNKSSAFFFAYHSGLTFAGSQNNNRVSYKWIFGYGRSAGLEWEGKAMVSIPLISAKRYRMNEYAFTQMGIEYFKIEIASGGQLVIKCRRDGPLCFLSFDNELMVDGCFALHGP